jgi:hypothetical protein
MWIRWIPIRIRNKGFETVSRTSSCAGCWRGPDRCAGRAADSPSGRPGGRGRRLHRSQVIIQSCRRHGAPTPPPPMCSEDKII